MKLKLAHEREIAILEVTEEVAARDIEVLRAGVLKFLASKHNRVILDLSGTRGLSADLLATLLPLAEAAAQRKGRLALVGQGDVVSQAVRTQAKAPAASSALYFPTRLAALAALHESVSAAPAATVDATNEALRARVTALAAENAALKAKAAALGDLRTLQELRRKNGALERRLAAIEELRTRLREEKHLLSTPLDLQRKTEVLSRALAVFLTSEGVLET